MENNPKMTSPFDFAQGPMNPSGHPVGRLR